MFHASVFFVCLFGLAFSQRDLTRVAGSKGTIVTEAVVDLIQSKCIFDDDRLFLRRLAYVESSDGEDAMVFNNGNSGGIWLVSSSQFSSISSSSSLTEIKTNIQTEFGIDWSTVSYNDLAKPLYSGLAASMVLESIGEEISGSKSAQGQYWAERWKGMEIDSNIFISKVNSLPGRSCTKPVDLVTVLDESGSVGSSNFRKMKNFIINLVGNLTIGTNTFHVGGVKFDSYAYIEFPFNADKNQIKTHIDSIVYTRGGTSIGRGIEKAHELFLNSTRKDATRAMLLLTDGRSNLMDTQIAAEAARNDSIVIFALGIGSINYKELNAAANKPNCTHLFVIDNFDEIDSILYQIVKSTCEVSKPVDVSGSKPVTVGGGLTGGDEVEDTLEINPGLESITSVEVNVICAVVKLYASVDTTKPNEAFYTVSGEATDGKPAVLQVENKGKTVYVTYKGKRKVTSEMCNTLDGKYNITVTPGKPPNIPSSGGGSSSCSGSSTTCDLPADVTNPCGSINSVYYYPNPKDEETFIQCDDWKNACVRPCAPGTKWNDVMKTCGHKTESSGSGASSTGGSSGASTGGGPSTGGASGNLCTVGQDGYFAVPGDNTKFVQCFHGNQFIHSCHSGLVFNLASKTCDWAPAALSARKVSYESELSALLRAIKKNLKTENDNDYTYN